MLVFHTIIFVLIDWMQFSGEADKKGLFLVSMLNLPLAYELYASSKDEKAM